MHPVLFEINIPSWLQGLFPEVITIYTYGFIIMMGAIVAITYTAITAKKKYGLPYEASNTLFVYLVIGAVVGGKIFFFFEDPAFYSKNLSRLFTGSGFVFYGSLLTCIPVMLWFFKKHKLPVRGMLDIMAITTCIVHAIGRLGCFAAGCCYGKPTGSSFGVVFSDPLCVAKPLHTHLHPTQLYDAGQIFLILLILLWIGKKKQFDGQVFLSYLILYAIGRGIVEIFRGDISRGFVIDGILSNSQFISIIIIGVAVFYYRKYLKISRLTKPKNR